MSPLNAVWYAALAGRSNLYSSRSPSDGQSCSGSTMALRFMSGPSSSLVAASMVMSAGDPLGVKGSRCVWRKSASMTSKWWTAAQTDGMSSPSDPTSPHIVTGTCTLRYTCGGGGGRPAALVCVGFKGGGLWVWEPLGDLIYSVGTGVLVQGTLDPGWGVGEEVSPERGPSPRPVIPVGPRKGHSAGGIGNRGTARLQAVNRGLLGGDLWPGLSRVMVGEFSSDESRGALSRRSGGGIVEVATSVAWM